MGSSSQSFNSPCCSSVWAISCPCSDLGPSGGLDESFPSSDCGGRWKLGCSGSTLSPGGTEESAIGVSSEIDVDSSLTSTGSNEYLILAFFGSKPMGLASGSRLAYCFRNADCQLSRLKQALDDMVRRSRREC